MKIPRDASSRKVISALKKHYGYEVSHQTGSHIQLTTHEKGEHHLTVPAHNPLRVGTLSVILTRVADHFDTTRDKIAQKLFG